MSTGDIWSTERWRRLLQRVRYANPDTSDAEDLLNEAYVRLQTYKASSQVANPNAFMVKVAANLGRDAARKARVRAGPPLGEEHHNIAFQAPLQDEAIAARERLAAVRRVLSQLSPRTRQAFLMHRVEGYKYREIAAHLDISASAVEKHIARAALAISAVTEDVDG